MNSKLLSIPLSLYKASVRSYTPRRAVMYVPGDDTRKLNKAFTLDVDCIAMDCEDGVAINRKDEARKTIRSILDKGKPPKDRNYDFAVRLNSLDSSLFDDDLESAVTAKNLPDTIILPKVENPEHIRLFSDKLGKKVKQDAKINLLVYIESAAGSLNSVDICKTAKDFSRNGKFILTTLLFGSDDLCADLGVTRTESSIEILYARQKLVLVAKAFGLQAIDMVYITYKDLEGLKKQSLEGARMGFTGKQIIHPGQIPIVQEAFLPSEEQINWAKDLLKNFEEYQKGGKGAFNYKGSMIDMPLMRQAQNILNTADLVKKK